MFSVVHNFTEECIQEADKYNWNSKIMFSEHWSLFVSDKYEFSPVWDKRKKLKIEEWSSNLPWYSHAYGESQPSDFTGPTPTDTVHGSGF